MKNKEIALEMGTTEHVVKNYLRVIYDKRGMFNRVELALWWVATHYKNERTKSIQPSHCPKNNTSSISNNTGPTEQTRKEKREETRKVYRENLLCM